VLELGTPGSVRGLFSNGHPYRNPRPLSAARLNHAVVTRTTYSRRNPDARLSAGHTLPSGIDANGSAHCCQTGRS
jgi:hypothetical protein